MEDLRNIVRWCSADHQPVNSMEEWMVLDVVYTTITQPIVSACAQLKD